MQRLPRRKRFSGFIQLAPLLAIAILLLVGILATSQKNSETRVLSESESGGGSSGSGKSSGSNSSGLSNEGTTTTITGSSGSGEGTEIKSSRKVETESKVENEDENEQEVEMTELENEDEFEVEEGTESAKIRIGKKEDKFLFLEQKFGAESEFPVSVNKTTRELTITTPAGTKVVAILPDSAVENMLAANVIDRLLATNGNIVEVKTDKDGNLIYEISGIKDKKLLGLFAVEVPKTLDVSTQTGQIVLVNQPLASRILDIFSF